MTVIAHPHDTLAAPTFCEASTRFERAANRAMTALLWVLPLLAVLLASRSVHGAVTVEKVTEPLFVSVDFGPIELLDAPASPERTKQIEDIATQIVKTAAEHPSRLIVIKPKQLTIAFDQLPGNLRGKVAAKPGAQRPTYEKSLSRVLKQIVNAVRAQNRGVNLSVNGLPVEPTPGGADLSEQTNLRYKALMNDLNAFVSARSIIASPSDLGEVMSVRKAMPAAVRLALGRPIYYRTDRGWHMTSGVPHIEKKVEPVTLDHVPGATGVGMVGSSSSGGSSVIGAPSSGGSDGSEGSGSGSGGGGGGSGGGGGGEYSDSEGGITGGGVLGGTSGVNNRPGGGVSSPSNGGSSGGSGGSSGGGTGGSGTGGSGSGSGGSGSGDGTGGTGGGSGGSGGQSEFEGFKFMINEEVYPAIEATFPQRQVQRTIILNDPVFDVNNDGIFDGISNMQYYFDILVPQDYDGPLCLDWEALAFDRLVGQSEFLRLQTVQEFVRAIQAAKQLRPSAQIGFYGLPVNEYFHRDAAWRAREQQFRPIYDLSDCLFPSIYDRFKDNQFPEHSAQRDATYVREVLEMAMEMAQGKPVYAYVWPRWHTSNATWGMQLIHEAEFKAHLAAIFTAKYGNDRVDGLAWWGADLYWRNISLANIQPGDSLYPWHSFLANLFSHEIPPGDTDVEHFTRIHTATLRQVAEVIAEAQE